MSLTIDCHMDVPHIWNKVCMNGDPCPTGKSGHPSSMFTVGKAKEGGLDAAIFALYLSDARQDMLTEVQADDEIQKQINRINLDLRLAKATTMDTAIYAHSRGILFPVFLGLEGGRLIHNSLQRLETLSGKGIKYLTLTHNFNTDWADSATDIESHSGLTAFGKEVVKKCNNLKVLVDVSHASDYTAFDALTTSSRPVIASHSGCRKLVKQPRNLTDDLIREIAATGGVICVPYAKRFIGHYKVTDHINHIVDLVGDDHVGIGSDLDGATMIPGFTSVSQWSQAILPDLVADGVSGESIAKILGGNLARVLEAP